MGEAGEMTPRHMDKGLAGREGDVFDQGDRSYCFRVHGNPDMLIQDARYFWLAGNRAIRIRQSSTTLK